MIQKTPTILKLRSETTKGNKLRENPLPRTAKLGGNFLHTEPVLQLMRKVKKIQKRHGDITSKYRHTHPFFFASRLVHGQGNLWKTTWRSYGRCDCDYGYLENVHEYTFRAAVHLGKGFEVNLRYVRIIFGKLRDSFSGKQKSWSEVRQKPLALA